MKFLIAISLSYLPLVSYGQEEADTPVQQAVATLVKPEITTRSIFPDRLAYARVYFDTEVEQPYLDIIENDSCRVLSIETYEPDAKENEHAKSAAIIQFQVKKAGIATLPTIPFESETKSYKTQPVQLIASELKRSDALSLTITPTKTKVYVGEPVRFDLTWNTNLPAAALQNLRLNPSFFSDESIEVAIPRTTQPKELQVGLPIGGRRTIAKWEKNPDNLRLLGKITLPIYVRFNKAGISELPETTLEISKLAKPKEGFAQYVAHFDNSFFIPTAQDQSYERLFTTSQAHTIEVLPLPNNEFTKDFSGIFSPAELSIQVKPDDTIEIGQLLELELHLKSEVPGPFLELSKLNEQTSLDERFLITGDYGKIWHEDATSFKQRLRILSTTIQSIPSLDFTIFNIETGKYEIITTPSIPLKVNPYQGQDTIALKNLNATQALTSNPEGIWHNDPKNSMNNFVQQLLHMINQHFWILLTIIAIVTAVFIPFILKARKRALNASYKLRTQAYKAFRKAPENSPEKWNRFLAWLASHFQTNDKAWTFSDTSEALEKIEANEEDLTTLTEIHRLQDESNYTEKTQAPDYSKLTSIAKRLSKLLPLLILTAILGIALAPTSAKAAEWEDAKDSFQQAQETSDPLLYSQAALLFETAANQHEQPATAWYNSGNAWFQAGELGRSIAAYRHAEQLKPWDDKIKENLNSARSLVATEVALKQTWWDKIPLITLKASTLCAILILCALALLTLRYRKKMLTKSSLVCGVIFIALLSATSIKLAQQKTSGVIITNKVNSKKGPSYAYAEAFDNSLKDGLEFHLLETRDTWYRIQLTDKRECWIPVSQAVLVK